MKETIEKIKLLDSYKDTSYYMYHLQTESFRYFSGQEWKGIPYYLEKLCEETKNIIRDNNISQETILQYIGGAEFENKYFFILYWILKVGTSNHLEDDKIDKIIDKKISLPEEIIIDENIISCLVTLFVLDTNIYNEWDFRSIVQSEKFIYDCNDYKLTKVQNVEFRKNGFIYDDKYYLYNFYINKSEINALSNMPAIFEIITSNICLDNADLYLRLDERLSVPVKKAWFWEIHKSQKFRGVEFSFSKTKLEKIKNIIVHYNPETSDKLLMVVKKDYDSILDEEFWHIELEQLPYIEENEKIQYIKTTFIHGKYYPRRDKFRHIDFIKNQYPIDEYLIKQNDCSTGEVKIDYYTTKECHYKILCVENTDIPQETWVKFSEVCLNEDYRKLFYEILEMHD